MTSRSNPYRNTEWGILYPQPDGPVDLWGSEPLAAVSALGEPGSAAYAGVRALGVDAARMPLTTRKAITR